MAQSDLARARDSTPCRSSAAAGEAMAATMMTCHLPAPRPLRGYDEWSGPCDSVTPSPPDLSAPPSGVSSSPPLPPLQRLSEDAALFALPSYFRLIHHFALRNGFRRRTRLLRPPRPARLVVYFSRLFAFCRFLFILGLLRICFHDDLVSMFAYVCRR